MPSTEQNQSTAFTFVELIVVTAVIVLAVALLFPIIQVGRESSRRSLCSEKMRRLVEAVHYYHDAHNCLPPFGMGGKESAHFTPHVQILPFIDQLDRWEVLVAADFNLKSFQKTAPWLGNFSELACPSDISTGRKPNESSPANYCYCNGDFLLEHCDDGATEDENAPRTRRGAFTVRFSWNLADITDGISNTIFISERCLGAPGTENKLKGGIVYPVQTFLYGPDACLLLRGVDDDYDLSKPSRNGALTGIGETGFLYGFWGFHGVRFTTILPPNAPSCSYSENVADDRALYPPTSYHTGGVNAAWGDGSVTFVSERIDTGDLSVTSRNLVSGKSPYGVWGAAGSVRGENSIKP